jgi:hypothetical protein
VHIPITHPNDETLMAFLWPGGLTGPEHASVEHHLAICDDCVALIEVAHARLAIAAEIPYAVPPQLQQRVMEKLTAPVPVVEQPAPVPAAIAAAQSWLDAIRNGLLALTRLPILVPTGFAVGVALMLVGNPTAWNVVPAGPMTRAVSVSQALRVTAPQAVVRAQPHARAQAIATLSHGEVVQVDREDREWYRFTLPGGAEGWVERGAFE